MNIARGLKAAAKSLISGPKAESFRAEGKVVACHHCENTLFHKRKASLNTALSSLTKTEWSDSEACVLVCANCSRLEWFLSDLEPEAGLTSRDGHHGLVGGVCGLFRRAARVPRPRASLRPEERERASRSEAPIIAVAFKPRLEPERQRVSRSDA